MSVLKIASAVLLGFAEGQTVGTVKDWGLVGGGDNCESCSST